VATLMQSMQHELDEMPDRGLRRILEESGYLKSIEALGEIESASRLENIRTLQEYIEMSMAQGLTPVEFMDRAALLQSSEEMQQGDSDQEDEAIAMMSLHRAKGLEFDCVVLPGVEEGQLPHQRALDEGASGISEERRLLYVGITRARQQLLLTSARLRRMFGETHYPQPSRFIKELSAEILDQEGGRASVPDSHPDTLGISIGSNVMHPSFGDGVILALEGSGDASRVTVQFQRAGIKRLMLKYAALQIY